MGRYRRQARHDVPRPSPVEDQVRTRGPGCNVVFLGDLCVLSVHVIYSSLRLVIQIPDSHEESGRPSTWELWKHLQSCICSCLSNWLEDSTSPLSIYHVEPHPNKGPLFLSWAKQRRRGSEFLWPRGTHTLVASARGAGYKQRFYLPVTMLSSLRTLLAPALHYTSRAKICQFPSSSTSSVTSCLPAQFHFMI